MRKLPQYILVFVLFFSIATLTTCAKQQDDNIDKKISESIAQTAKDVRLATNILGLWSLEKSEDATGEVETLQDFLYVAYMSDGHIVNVNGEGREEVTEEYLQKIMKTAHDDNARGNYKAEYQIQDGTIYKYDTQAQPIDTLNIVNLENDELIVFSEDEKVTSTYKKIYSWLNMEATEDLENNLEPEEEQTVRVLKELEEIYATNQD